MPVPFEIGSIALPEDSEVHALLEACPDAEGVQFKNDEFIVHGDDTDLDIFLLLRGDCLVEQPDAPRERTPGSELAVIQASPESPMFIGEMAYLGGGYRTASVRSVMATFAIRLKPAHLDTIMATLPGMTRILCDQFTRRLGEANTFIKAFQKRCSMDVSQRFLQPGDTLVDAGASAAILYQIVDGSLEIANTGEPIEPGEDGYVFVDVEAFLTDGVHPKKIVAKTSCIVVGLGNSRKEAIIRNYPEIALNLLAR